MHTEAEHFDAVYEQEMLLKAVATLNVAIKQSEQIKLPDVYFVTDITVPDLKIKVANILLAAPKISNNARHYLWKKTGQFTPLTAKSREIEERENKKRNKYFARLPAPTHNFNWVQDYFDDN